MNNRGQIMFVFVIVAIILMMVAFAFIEPFKESLDNNRGGSTLNCPGTLTFNQTAYDDDTVKEKLTRRPTCLVTGISMVWFIGAFLFALVMWVARNGGKAK